MRAVCGDVFRLAIVSVRDRTLCIRDAFKDIYAINVVNDSYRLRATHESDNNLCLVLWTEHQSSDKRNPFLIDASAPEVGFGSGNMAMPAKIYKHLCTNTLWPWSKADADSLTTMSSAQCSTTADRWQFICFENGHSIACERRGKLVAAAAVGRLATTHTK